MDALPPNAQLYLPVLIQEYKKAWPTIPVPAFLGAQIEQETCASLRSKRCWNPKTENINPKNNGEYGFGLGMLTKTNRFNAFEESKQRFAAVRDWQWEDRLNPVYQIRTMIHMDKAAYDIFKKEKDEDRLAFAFSAYNGGTGGVLNDRKYCAQFPKCNPSIWLGNVETHSRKSRLKLGGYSISAYEINREYVHNIMHVRFEKYQPAIQ